MKILHLEDNAIDAELIHTGLREEWPDCSIILAASADTFRAGLSAGPDLILSDFNMPGYNGLEALQLAHAQSPDVPFIFLSGTIGEERALEALRSGASDYIIKDRPQRLVPAVKRALNDVRLARERRATEEQMQRVQRLENIGMLAAGIAHDFNNVLTPLLMGIPLVKSRQPDAALNKLLDSMEASALRGAGLVKQILGFAHGVTGEAQLLQPRHLLQEIIGVMEQTFPKTIVIEENVPNSLWPIKANPTQFHQVILNLCVNARDAMAKGGTLTIAATNRALDEPGAASRNTPPGPYVSIEITDTGTGISPEVQARIWEPFFTTKGGKGTGLGLATVRGLVEEHAGTIALHSVPGRGTTFTLLFPATPGLVPADVDAARVALPRGANELVLVVDDDPAVRDLTSATLTGHGYRAITAADGTEAVALFAARSLEISVVITDLDMPNLDGAALSKVVRSLNPSVRVILISGSTDISDPRRDPPPAGAFLAKPFSSEILLRTTHRLLHDTVPVPAASWR